MLCMQDFQVKKIARFYYEQGLTLKHIADKLSISTATVSRMITRAKREGIVDIIVHDEHLDFMDIEYELGSSFGLKECRIS